MAAKPIERTKIQFVALDDIAASIAERTRRGESENTKARTDLERYYWLMEQATPTFSEQQANLLLDIHNGTLFEPIAVAARMIWANAEDAENAYYEKWGVDRAALVKRLRTLSAAEAVALIDAMERFWADEDATPQSVGLVA